MRKILLACLAMLLMVGVASAGWSIRQKADGGAYWLNDKDSREEHVLVTHLVAELSNVTLAGTTFIVSPITGTIEKVYAVITGALAGANETISIWASNAVTGVWTTFPSINEVTNGSTRMVLTYGESREGSVYTFTPNSATANKVGKGGRIAIGNSGGSTDGNVRAVFTIIINPK